MSATLLGRLPERVRLQSDLWLDRHATAGLAEFATIGVKHEAGKVKLHPRTRLSRNNQDRLKAKSIRPHSF